MVVVVLLVCVCYLLFAFVVCLVGRWCCCCCRCCCVVFGFVLLWMFRSFTQWFECVLPVDDYCCWMFDVCFLVLIVVLSVVVGICV